MLRLVYDLDCVVCCGVKDEIKEESSTLRQVSVEEIMLMKQERECQDKTTRHYDAFAEEAN